MRTPARVLLAAMLLGVFSLSAFATGTKLYLATNKERYAPGESILFQAFLLDRSATTNNSLFIELLDCRGNVLSKKMLPFYSNIAWGNIDMPEKSDTACYLLYCYVRNQYGIEKNFFKPVYVSGTALAPLASNELTVSSFIEGHTLVNGCPANVLIKCTGDAGAPRPVTGKLVNDKQEVLETFRADEQGYAKCSFTPEKGGRYFIAVQDTHGTVARQPLPAASDTGITLELTAAGNAIGYTAFSYSNEEHVPEYTLEVLSNNQVVYTGTINFQKGLSYVSEEVGINKLPPGFLKFRIVNKAGNEYCSRVMYNWINKEEDKLVRVIDTISKKEAVIRVPGYINGKAYLNIISAGSTEIDTRQNDQQPYIDLPDETPLSFNDHLISLLYPPAGPASVQDTANRFLSLKGTLYDADQKPVRNKPVSIIIHQANKKKDFFVISTDKDGVLQLNNLIFYDSAAVYYQLAGEAAEKNTVRLQLEITPDIRYTAGQQAAALMRAKYLAPGSNARYDSTSNIITGPTAKLLQEVRVKGNKPKTESEKFREKYVSPQYDQKAFLSGEFDFIQNPQMVDQMSLFDFLKGRFAGLIVGVARNGIPNLSSTRGGSVGIILDNMELRSNYAKPNPEDYQVLANLRVSDVALVRYYSMSIKPKPGTLFDGGDLVIYTKKDFAVADPKIKGMAKAMVAGYSAPALARAAPPGALPSSLYWQPDFEPHKAPVIYIGLPVKDPEMNVQLVIEGVNDLMAPYRFAKNLVFL